MSSFAKGKYAQAISDRSGQAFPYNEMVREWNGAFVHVSEFEPKHPQLEPKPVAIDGQGLPNARPQTPAPVIVYLDPQFYDGQYLTQNNSMVPKGDNVNYRLNSSLGEVTIVIS